jgi:hAT family C-terminal dimerisation region
MLMLPMRDYILVSAVLFMLTERIVVNDVNTSKVASISKRMTWWKRATQHFPVISTLAVRLLSSYVTSCATECNIYVKGPSLACRHIVHIRGNSDSLTVTVITEVLRVG